MTGYKIFIKQHEEVPDSDSTNDVYIAAPASCDGQSEEAMVHYYCYISIFDLHVPPYSLLVHESIEIKVIATNSYGDSDYSEAGNGAETRFVPDAPINLTRDEEVTDAYVIRFTWTEGLSDGSTPVIDYDVYWD